jgi:hypothetical protein
MSTILGAGYSARVIQHTTSNDVFDVTGKNPIVEAGTVVALKQIATRPLQNGEDETTAISEAYHSAWQEYKICRHPFCVTMRTFVDFSTLAGSDVKGFHQLL